MKNYEKQVNVTLGNGKTVVGILNTTTNIVKTVYGSYNIQDVTLNKTF